MAKHPLNNSEPKKDPIGGQAVIEGVFLRAPWGYSLAVRNPKNEIESFQEPYEAITKRYPFLNVPVLRGACGLFEQLFLGIKMLNKSAEIAMHEEEDDLPKWLLSFCEKIAKAYSFKKETVISYMENIFGGLMTVAGIALAFGVFMVLPHALTQWIIGSAEKDSPLIFNAVAGIVRVVVFILYILGVSRFEDMRRVFEYHGAEHKMVFNYEDSDDVSIESARKYQTAHPRCGTNFIFIVMLVSIFLFTFMTSLIIKIHPEFAGYHLFARKGIIIAVHLIVLPLLTGISYEIMRLNARFEKHWWSKIINAPGMLFQSITTSEPDDDQLEVALHSIQALLKIRPEEK